MINIWQRYAKKDSMMPRTKPFSQLTAQARSDPQRRAQIDAIDRAIADVRTLADLRNSQGQTQRQIAGMMHVSQANVSRVEHQEDLYLSTLREYVAALGGELELTAVFSESRVTFTPQRR
jgi:DNA-directed RNA polymerase specialized sigma subunit